MTADILETHLSKQSKSTSERSAVRVTETALRDGHQSLLATRMRTEDMIPILKKMDQVGYWSVEMWGGATFDSCLRFLREDPWERLRLIRKHMPNTRLQMLMRGQNIVGYRHYPDDIVEQFINNAANQGIDVFRIFDALNDVRNMKKAIETVLKAGKIAEGAISYTISPHHTVERYVELAKELEALGCQTLCIKDMAGLLSPFATYQLVRQLKANVDIPIHLHSHCTSGMAETSYMKGIEAGVDIIDGAISSLAGGTSQPPTESFVAMLQQSPYDTGLDLGLLTEIAEYFKEARKKYAQFESAHTGVDPQVLRNQIPGGMISNLANQLREQDALDKMEEVLKEVPKVRAQMGYPPLVTPTSQIVGTQATLNVILGEPYKSLTLDSRNLLLGKYGACPAECDPELQAKAEEQQKEKATKERPADLLEPLWEASLEAAKAYQDSENPSEQQLRDDALSYAIFPQVAKTYFEQRAQKGPSNEEAAAAIAALLHKLRQDANAEEQANGLNGTQKGINPWKWAGRIEGIGSRF